MKLANIKIELYMQKVGGEIILMLNQLHKKLSALGLCMKGAVNGRANFVKVVSKKICMLIFPVANFHFEVTEGLALLAFYKHEYLNDPDYGATL